MKYNVFMTMKNFEETAYWMLLQVSIRAKHDFAKLADVYDLTIMQIITLCSVKPGEPVPMSMISGLLVCDASNVTGIVDRLVQRGYLLRQESEGDRRVKVLRLTVKGERLRDAVLHEISTSQPTSMAALSPSEFETLHRLLKKALLPKI